MEEMLEVSGRIAARHPEIAPADVAHAWGNRIATGIRSQGIAPQLVAVGFDASGRMLEMVGVEKQDGTVLIFHAMTPPSKKTLREVSLI